MDATGKGDGLNKISKDELISLYRFGYTFGRKIGEGSTAAVFVAQHIEGPKSVTVACKVYSEKGMSKEFQRKFMPRELSILYSLDHENIVKLHSIVKGKGYFYLFTEYAEHGDLFDYLSENGALVESKARDWYSQIVEGLKYLHRKEIAHRDLKCENILLSNGGRLVKIADFGFTRYCIGTKGDRVKSSTFCGSTAYAAPEIIKGIPYAPKTADVWSSGVVLFALLQGALPFNESDPHKLYKDQMNRCWRFGSDKRVTDPVKNLMSKLLEPQPGKRFSIEKVAKHKWLKGGKKHFTRKKSKSA